MGFSVGGKGGGRMAPAAETRQHPSGWRILARIARQRISCNVSPPVPVRQWVISVPK